MTVARAQGFPHWVAALHATGTALWRPEALALLADACGRVGHTAAGLRAVADALEAVHHTGERLSEAELYRLQRELLCQQTAEGDGAHLTLTPEAEACFQQALEH